MEWIKVEDELPENRQDVLIWSGKWIDFCLYRKSLNEFISQDGDRYYPYDIKGEENKATHWMPLPKPPKK